MPRDPFAALQEGINGAADRVRLNRLAIAACAGLRDTEKAAELIEAFTAMADQMPVAPGADALVRQHLHDIAMEIGKALQRQGLHGDNRA
jgi:hypothetical protein